MRKTTLVLIILMCFNLANAQNNWPPVVRLKSMYSGDSSFRQLIGSMFANVQNLPDGSPNFWKNKNMNDMCVFLNVWFYKLPTVSKQQPLMLSSYSTNHWRSIRRPAVFEELPYCLNGWPGKVQ